MEKQIKRLLLSNFLYGLVFYVPIFALFLLNNDISLSVVVYGQTIYSVAALLSEIPTGIIADRFGHNKSITLGYFINVLAMLVIMLFPSVGVLFAFQIMRGVAGGLLSGSKEALLYEYGEGQGRNFKKDLSHFASFQMIGFALSAFITGVAIGIYGQSSYVYMILATAVAFALATFVSLTLPYTKTKLEVGQSKFREINDSLALFKANKVLKVLFLVVALTYGGKYLLIDLYQPYFVLNNVDPFYIGFALSIGSLFSFFLLRNIHRIEKPLRGPRAALGLVAALTGLFYVLLGMVEGQYILVAVFVILFGLTETVTIFISDYANKHSSSHIRATVLSTIGLSQEAFKASYKIVFGIAVGIFTLSQIFVVYGLYLVFGAVISYMLLRVDEKIRA